MPQCCCVYKRGKCGTPLVTNFLHTRGLRLAFQNFSLKSLSLSLTHTFLSKNTFLAHRFTLSWDSSRLPIWGQESVLGHKVTKFTPYNFSPLYYLLPPFAHNLSQLLITHNPLDRLPSPPDQVDSGQRVVWRVETKCTTVHWRVWTSRLHHKGALLSAQSGRRLSRGTHPTPLVSISYSTHAGLVCHSIDMC